MTAESYVREVELALRDLPWSQRRDLIADLRLHLADLPPETDLVARLGTPERYAADLRAAEGIERRRGLVAFLRARRPRNVILVTLLVVVLALAIGATITAVVYVDRYQPLSNAGFGLGTPGMKPSPGQDGNTVLFHQGRPFFYGIGITNDGRYGVRILGALRPGSGNDFFTGRLLMSKDEHCEDAGRLEPFHPFEMKPDACRFLVFKGVFKCGNTAWPGGHGRYNYDSFGLTDFSVRYSFLWRTATVAIPQTDPLEISFQKEGCPLRRSTR